MREAYKGLLWYCQFDFSLVNYSDSDSDTHLAEHSNWHKHSLPFNQNKMEPMCMVCKTSKKNGYIACKQSMNEHRIILNFGQALIP